MANYIRIITIAVLLLTATSCIDLLDKEPKNKITESQLFSSEAGVRAHLANLYSRLPIEDFNYSPNKGFNIGVDDIDDVNNSGFMSAHFCDEAIHPEYNDWGEEYFDYWSDGYSLLRNINSFIANVPDIDVLSSEKKLEVKGEAHFMRAYTYFSLAKRYGGLPLITVAQEYTGQNSESLRVSRSTEKETWDFILEECDSAYLCLSGQSTTDASDPRKATCSTTLALKSRAALYAASIAKFTHSPYVSLSGEAVDNGLVGISSVYADTYYKKCIEACEEIIASGNFALANPNPASADEAAENYRKLFQTPTSYLSGAREPIFIKSYVAGTTLTHNYDIWFRPKQVQSELYPGRMDPTLDLVDIYEDYTDNGTGASAPIKTRTDGNESNYGGFDKNATYISYPLDLSTSPFKGKDARMLGTILCPGDYWGNTRIIIQGGMVITNSNAPYLTQVAAKGPDGVTYYTYAASDNTQYSGFDPSKGNYTRSGFLFKKFMQMDNDIEHTWRKSTTDWIEFRYAEILLNYAESVIEMSISDAAKKVLAEQYLNDIRHRAAHTDNIPLTEKNVRKERQVELAFENKRKWDMIRWRTFHEEFNSRTKKGLVPYVDLRSNPVTYIFVRVNPSGVEAKTFYYTWYYKDIPGISSNGLIQNP